MKKVIISALVIAVMVFCIPVGAVAETPLTTMWPLGSGGEQHEYNAIPFQMHGVDLNVHKTPAELVATAGGPLPPFNASKVHVIQTCAWATDLPDGVVVAQVNVYYGDASSETLDLVIGDNTAEWAYDRPENQPLLQHTKIPPAYSYWTNVDSDYWYLGHHFYACVETDPMKVLDHIELVLDENAYSNRYWLGVVISAITVETAGAPPKTTGGGWISDHEGSGKCNFGFTVQSQSGQLWPKGNLNYQDKSLDINFKSVTILKLATLNDGVIFSGWGEVNNEDGYFFVVRVEDNGEPGKDADMLSMRIIGPDVDYLNEGLLGNGNIQTQIE